MTSIGKVHVVGSYIVALVMDTDRIPVEGETVLGRNYHDTHGGKGSNMAVAAARLGAQVNFIGRVGDDDFGRSFKKLLVTEGVNGERVSMSQTSPTATGIILFTSHGTNAIVISDGANGEFTPSLVRDSADLIGAGDVVISPLEIPFETALAGADVAKSKGAKAILNPAPARDLRGENLARFFAITPNETEARVCLGLDPNDPAPDEELAQRLLALGAENVIITRGKKGVMWASSDGIRVVPALQVNAIDMVGAGDAFNAGLSVGLAEGKSILDAICLGVTTASLSTEKRETIESYPSRAEVDTRLPEVAVALSSQIHSTAESAK